MNFSRLLTICGLNALLMALACQDSLAQGDQPPVVAAADDAMRIESEDKLSVPSEQAEATWRFLYDFFIGDGSALRAIDASFSAYMSEEAFVDTYFDTPELALLGRQSSVRHRRRTNLTDPNDKKSGRELVQIKVNAISDNALHRGEYKFEVVYHHKFKSMEDKHPVLGLIKRGDRVAFKQTLAKLDIEAADLQPILTLTQRRRRIYISYNNAPFMTLSLDEVRSEALWAKIQFVELEPELNEIAYTEGDAILRNYMDEIAAKVTAGVRAGLPYLQRDLTPKYNKAFEALASKIPFYRFLVRHGLI